MCWETSSLIFTVRACYQTQDELILPEIQIVHGTLLVPHVNIERKEVDWGEGSTTENLKKGRKAIPRLRVDKVVRHVDNVQRVEDGESPAPKIRN